MVSTDDTEDNLFKKHHNLINKLNLDEETATKAWETFQTIRTNYTLEGDLFHWLGCAVFVACRTQTIPTVGSNSVEGNCVSLTSLLRFCNLSLVHFFNKIKKWADMANLSEDFRQKIENLEGNFAVACNIFKEFYPMFSSIFKNPNDTETPRQHRNRKQRTPCTPTQVFEFCWLLFITVKGEDNACSLDLVTSYHLLQACCDLAFKNAFLDDRRDLLNTSFQGLPVDWFQADYKVPKEAPCIIDILCTKHKNMITDAKYVKEYTWKIFIRNLFDQDILHGDEENFAELLNPSNFDTNLKNITKAYEAHLLNKGDFDERIFLAEYRRRLIMREHAISNGNVFSPFSESGDASATDSPRINPCGELTQRAPDTPLTGRCYLGPKDQNEVTPLSTATQSVARLHSLLIGRTPAISENLAQIFQSCTLDPTENITTIVADLGDKFCARYTQQGANAQTPQTDYANKRLQFAITLFYKLLEKILQEEKKKLEDISPLLEKNKFYECLFACCLEIVIYSYNSQRKFPWILQALEVSEFYFVRVIELIVRSEDQLSRDAVKHLNLIEETILESCIWKTGSLLWDAVKQSGDEIPKYEEIALPKNMVYSGNIKSSSEKAFPQNNGQVPGPSAVETFQSPIPQVKKQLFPIRTTTGQTILQNVKPPPTHIMVTDSEGNKKFIPLIDTSAEQPVIASPSPVPEARPKKNGSLCIIFRKFYNLAGERMEHLCNRLGITDVELKCKIWTVFEYSIRSHTDLIRDRHLDQLLMCAVYVVCKVTENKEKNFSEIMKCYRSQPQANSNIYRDVLLNMNSEEADKPDEPTRGDLIQFYNSIYVQVMKSFAPRFSKSTNQDKNLLLSPIPSVRCLIASPKQQITKNVFVKPYESPGTQSSTGKSYNYFFSRSASKDLKAINVGIGGKRKLLDNFEDDVPNKRFAERKVQTLLEQRRVQSME